MENRYWIGKKQWLNDHKSSLAPALARVARPIFLVGQQEGFAVASRGDIGTRDAGDAQAFKRPLLAWAPPILPENLGSRVFKQRYGLRYAYVMGAMAHGISSVEMVKAAGKNGMLGFFGAGGLSLSEIEAAIDKLQQQKELPFGFNLIHSPGDPHLEEATVDLYLQRKVGLISASAFMGLTMPLVRYRLAGLERSPNGSPVCRNRIMAKVSREEVAEKFFGPAPADMVAALLDKGLITRQQAELASMIPMADDLTAEADSGGHTDNRPALALLPTLIALGSRLAARYSFSRPVGVGLGGGIATPQSVAAAFSMGAAYVLTGSINQACVEAGTSDTVKQMLAQARQADVTMAPAGDMFELGVKVQVLKRGTMFAMRAARLYDIYSRYESWEAVPAKEQKFVEQQLLRSGFTQAWQQTAEFFSGRDPGQITRAQKDPKHKMALVFRSYLGRASVWARQGLADRTIDYQIWCGPAMGAFNQWAEGSFLARAENRRCVDVALNLLYGAAVLQRAVFLMNQGVELGPEVLNVGPLPRHEIEQLMTQAL